MFSYYYTHKAQYVINTKISLFNQKSFKHLIKIDETNYFLGENLLDLPLFKQLMMNSISFDGKIFQIPPGKKRSHLKLIY